MTAPWAASSAAASGVPRFLRGCGTSRPAASGSALPGRSERRWIVPSRPERRIPVRSGCGAARELSGPGWLRARERELRGRGGAAAGGAVRGRRREKEWASPLSFRAARCGGSAARGLCPPGRGEEEPARGRGRGDRGHLPADPEPATGRPRGRGAARPCGCRAPAPRGAGAAAAAGAAAGPGLGPAGAAPGVPANAGPGGAGPCVCVRVRPALAPSPPAERLRGTGSDGAGRP